jgi:dihydropyrimidinase
MRGEPVSVLVKGGRVVTAVDDYAADVLIDGETVSAIGAELDVAADRVIDARGKYVIPGAIDPPHAYGDAVRRHREL